MATDADLYAAQTQLEDAYLQALQRAHALSIVRLYEETFHQLDDLPLGEQVARLNHARDIIREAAAGRTDAPELHMLSGPPGSRIGALR
ncbi:hypothetical protein [Roseicella frigidaeris]|uniref:Uncharacterized protein n=1 Tax=Roseicella frigidaeris TaxID=2230885 RepID=A0A327M7T1_9PROT|nr:hypothetical protein [Roseicella frigidaeris]RAI59361.1 hypothetical protein DOO78_10070 [Roseicella frigidaeris]